jgi:alkyl hydroperoxide reductase subunit AhpF
MEGRENLMAFLNDQDAAFVRQRLAAEMAHDVRLIFFAPSAGGLALPGQDAEMAEYTRRILKEVAGLSDRLSLEEHSMISEPEVAAQYRIERTPATAVVAAQDYGVRYYGMPAGYEFVTLLDLIVDASRGHDGLLPATRETLAALSGDVHLQVFVTTT